MALEDSRWRVRLPDGSGREYSFDDLIAAMKRGEVTRHTFINAPAKPDVFKPAGEWGLFWQKFGTRPWKIEVNGTEHTAHGDAELRQWASSGRIRPDTQVYDPVEEEWVKAVNIQVLTGAFKAGCLSILTFWLQ